MAVAATRRLRRSVLYNGWFCKSGSIGRCWSSIVRGNGVSGDRRSSTASPYSAEITDREEGLYARFWGAPILSVDFRRVRLALASTSAPFGLIATLCHKQKRRYGRP